MARLIFTGEDGNEQSLHLGPTRTEVVAGRQAGCDLYTRNNTVSRRHARFVWTDGRVRVIDNQSANGTWVRKERVAELDLEDGETVFLGAFQVTVRLDPEDRTWQAGATVEEPPPLIAPQRSPASMVQPRSTVGWTDPPPVPARPTGALAETIGYSEAAPAVPASSVPRAGEDDGEVIFLEEEEEDEEAHAPVRGGQDQPPMGQVEPGPNPFQQRVLELERLLAEGQQRQRQMEVQIEDLTRVLDHQTRELRETEPLRERAAGLEQALATLQVDHRRLEADLQEAQRRASVAEAMADEAGRERDLLREEQQRWARRLEEAEGRLAAQDAEVAGLRLQLQEAQEGLAEGRQVDLLRQRVEILEKEVSEARQQVQGAETRWQEAAARRDEVETRLREAEELRKAAEGRAHEAEQARGLLQDERDRLLEEVERWEELKRQFEEDRAALQGEVETWKRRVGEVTAEVERARQALGEAREEGGSVQALVAEVAELKAANRAALKKVARLMEELEQAQSRTAGPDPRVEDLTRQVEDLQRRLQERTAERDRLQEFADRLQQRVTSLESATPPVSSAEVPTPIGEQGPDAGSGAGATLAPATPQPVVPEAVREAIERINSALSEIRLGLEVLAGLVPEVLARLPDGAGEDGEQVRTALEDLGGLVGELKAEVVQVRRLV